MHQALVFLLVLVTWSDAFVCRSSNTCFCYFLDNSYKLECQNGNYTLAVTYRSTTPTSVILQCPYDSVRTEFDAVRGSNFGPVDYVKFQYCALPLTPMLNIFQDVGISNVKHLLFHSAKNLTDSLQSGLFENLNLTSLSLEGNGFTSIPKGTFDGLQELQYLSLRDNRLVFPHDFAFDMPLLESLSLGSNNLETLPSDIFFNLSSLNTLNLESNRLSHLSREWFRSLGNLTTLDLHRNRLRLLDPDVFADLKKLKDIRLTYNIFASLPDGLFTLNQELEKIALIGNDEDSLFLNTGVFANLSRLGEVFLNNSGIAEVSNELFDGSIDLKNVSFAENKLQTLPEDLFSTNVKLEYVDVSRNSIESLPDGIFRNLRELHFLDLSYNKLQQIQTELLKDLSKLKILNLQNNNIYYANDNSFAFTQALQQINLSNNRLNFTDIGLLEPNITSAYIFQHCRNLEILKLSNNSITELHEDWLLNMQKLQLLDLRDNAITSLLSTQLVSILSNNIAIYLQHNKIRTIDFSQPGEVLVPNAQTTDKRLNRTIFVANNPIDCTCRIFHFVQFLRGEWAWQLDRQFEVRTGDLVCATPHELQGRNVRAINEMELTCDVNVSCPRKCKCSVRLADQATIVQCQGAGLRSLPHDIPTYKNTNHTVLNVNNNHLQNLTVLDGNYAKVTELYASNNNISLLASNGLPPRLSVLYLNNNNLTHVPKSVVEYLDKAINESRLSKVAFNDNPWACDCASVDFQKFLQAHFQYLVESQRIHCNAKDVQLTKLTVDELCPDTMQLVVALCVSLAAALVITVAVAVFYCRHQYTVRVWLYSRGLCLWFVSEQEMDKDKTYDAFVSYHHGDEEFVVSELVSKLETEEPRFKLCIHIRDWLVGEWVPNQIVRSVDESRRTIVVLSKNFLESVWGKLEFKAAHLQALQDKTKRVIIIVYGDVPKPEELDEELRAYVTMNTYLKWGDPWFWQKLRYAMPHPPNLKRLRNKKKDDRLELIRTEILNHRNHLNNHTSNNHVPNGPDIQTGIVNPTDVET